MKVNWLLVLGLGVGAVVLYNVVKNSAPAALTGQPNSYNASAPGSYAMKVGDTFSVTGPTGAPTAAGTQVFGGSETVLAQGAANAVAAGTETLTWPNWGTITVTVS